MALFSYTAATPRIYPEYGFLAVPGDVADFGAVAMPNDGRWTTAAPGAIATKRVGPGAPSYQMPGVPADGEVLAWDNDLGQFVPVDLTTVFATSDGAGGLTVGGQQVTAYAPVAAAWKANTAYVKDQLVIEPGGTLVRAKAAFTSGANYVVANWTAVAGGAGVSNVAIDTDGVPYVQTGANAAQIVIDTDGVPYLTGASA